MQWKRGTKDVRQNWTKGDSKSIGDNSDGRECRLDQSLFVIAEGMHVVPPPMTGNYMPSRPEIEVDYSQFTYGPKQTQPSESESQSSEFDTCKSNISAEPSELVSELVVNESNVECQPKVWSDTPIIEEYESDTEDEYVSIPTKQQETPSFANQQRKTQGKIVIRKIPTWLFDLGLFNISMNYHPVRSENQANHHAGHQEANQNAGTEDIIDAGDSEIEDESAQGCFIGKERWIQERKKQSLWNELERLKRQEKEANEEAEALRKKFEQEDMSTYIPVSTVGPYEGLSLSDPTNPEEDDSEIPPLEDIYQNSTDGIFTTSSYDDEGAVADFTNLETVVNVSPIPTSRIHSTHPKALILGDPNSAVQTRSKVNTSSGAHAFVSYLQKQKRTNHKDFHHCLFACFLSQHEPKKISEALEDESWVDAMQEELLQFEIQKVWVLVDLPYGKKAIGTKWVYRNKKDERGVVVRNKARLVAQGHRQEEEIDYDEVFASVVRLEAIRIFLAFASYMGFIVYQMDVKSAFLYGKIDEEVYVSQPPGFLDPKYPQKVYKIVKALYGLHQAPKAWYATLSTFLLKNG
ncbi:putative ribonuclease H-like domain-containing protein [Tanacetum coccineum]|uniref:Ribonuclease H-like domain-containing protein n=1 Tax=Tanacetum coccineum TaxID=301880 RepID=A0ABQ5A5S2_9ASTR